MKLEHLNLLISFSFRCTFSFIFLFILRIDYPKTRDIWEYAHCANSNKTLLFTLKFKKVILQEKCKNISNGYTVRNLCNFEFVFENKIIVI